MKLFTSLILLSCTLVGSAQNWLPVGRPTPFSSGTYSVSDKAYFLFRDPEANLLYASGDFDSAGTVKAANFASWNELAWSPVAAEPARVTAMTYFRGVLYAAGTFTNGGNTTAGIATWSGSAWTVVAPGTGPVLSLAVYNDRLYAGGAFSSLNSVAAPGLAMWDGTAWSAVPIQGNPSDGIAALLVFNNELYIGGEEELGKWNGTQFTDLHFGLDVKVYDMEIYGGKLHIGGSVGVARLEGSSWTVIGGNADKDVFALRTFNNLLYAGGQFSTLNGTTLRKIAAWNGQAWSAAGQLSDVFSLETYNGRLYAAGDFGVAMTDVVSGITVTDKLIAVEAFPNPAADVVRVSSSGAISRLRVMDLTGKEIFVSGVAGQEYLLDLAPYESGTYLLRVATEDGDSIVRIVKR